MTPACEKARGAAADWLIRQRDPAFEEWEAFTQWLEADPAHATEFQRLMALDAALAKNLRLGPGGAATAPQKRAWPLRAMGGFGAAAALVVAAVLSFGPSATTRYAVDTAQGQRKHILLEDGSRVVLDGDTRVQLDPEHPREVTLESGEALFDVVHNADIPFRVRFDGGSVRNLGTRFTVRRRGTETQVAVSQGAVAFDAGPHQVELRPGQKLEQQGRKLTVAGVAVDEVGRFATPRLSYSDARLALVGADLSRELGAEVAIAPQIADRRVTMTFQLELDTDRSMRRLAALLDLQVRKTGEGWVISAAR
ncbi:MULTISPECIES: FecR domain-containing protein [unclassified Sphingobium]|uniref:FecR family protein n=1 Tax=unclassified Sphingobium TaxID=2611147 RepID=UPI0035A5A9B3